MLDIRLIERGLEKPGKTKGGLATAMGVRPGAVSEILSGIRLIKASEIAPIIDYLELNSVPIMGRVGAGASIEPEHEQVPPEGLGEVELPFPIAERPSLSRYPAIPCCRNTRMAILSWSIASSAIRSRASTARKLPCA
jgi:hypothetical protein